jgi:pimeloyl-ACP methyl ester carboxylesterase
VTVYDNVSVQHRLVTEKFGIEKLALVTGWSMGAGQTYQWAVSYPEMVTRILPFCGSAKTSEHNIVFLEGVKAGLEGGLVRRAANHGSARRGARVRRLGPFPGFLLEETVYETPDGLFVA